MNTNGVINDLNKFADKKKAELLQGYFKTGKRKYYMTK
jgi:hypothetical protein